MYDLSHKNSPAHGQINTCLSTSANCKAYRADPDEEIRQAILEYGTNSRLISKFSWDGTTIKIESDHPAAAGTAVFSQRLTLPPGLTLELINNTIIKITDIHAGVFNENSAGRSANCHALLNEPDTLNSFQHLFIVSQPFETEEGIEANLYCERYPFLAFHGRNGSHSSGIYKNDVQEFIDSFVRDSLSEKDLALFESEISLQTGTLKVLGPDRFGEVLLLTSQESLNPDTDLRYYYNPSQDTLRVTFEGSTELEVTGGSFSSKLPSFEFKTPKSGCLPAGVDFDSTYIIDPVMDNQNPFESVSVSKKQ